MSSAPPADAPLALLVDHDRTAVHAHRELLQNGGLRCEVAYGTTTAWRMLVEQDPDVVILSLELRDQGALSFADRIRDEWEGKRPRLVGVCYSDFDGALLDLDAVVRKPTPPRALLDVALDRRPHDRPSAVRADRVASLIGTSMLSGDQDESRRNVAHAVREAFGAAACFIFIHRPDRCWSQGAFQLGRRHLEEVARRAVIAARAGTTVVMSSLVTRTEAEDYERAFESYHARAVGAEDGKMGVVLCVVHREHVSLSDPERALLDALTRRIEQELGWQSVHQRLVTELDSMRDVGGLDPMLGIWSRGTLARLLDMMESACRRSREPLSIALLDVRGLGAINDRHGHHEGDAVLKHVAEVAVYVVRAYDIVARYGGDEIAVVFVGATLEEATSVVERLRRTVQAQPFETDGGDELVVEICAGISAFAGSNDTAHKTLSRAVSAVQRARDDDSGLAVVSLRDTQGESRGGAKKRPSLDGLTLGGVYRILHQIGAGGGGGVYRGEDLSLRRPVAVKVLDPELARDDKLVDRFRDEAAILASIRHNNLVQIYAFGVEANYAYFVMELVEGESLYDAIRRSQKEKRWVPVDRVASVVKQIASALATLHRSGIIHRDVKPANILMDPFRGRAVLVDVGIAERPGERGTFAGTPGYMAPEVLTSRPLDPSADVYGLAVTIYELLTLRLPWTEHDQPLTMLRIQREEPAQPPSTVRRELAPLDDVLLRALDVEPTRRWPDVGQFAAAIARALERIAAHVPSDRTPLSTPLSTPDAMPESRARPTWAANADTERPSTRAVVFRSLARVVGARNVMQWRIEVGRKAQHLADALSPSSPPLGWLPTEWLVELLESGPPGGRDAVELGRDLGRATVRTTFRRFFPASSATLSPSSTIQALPQIWAHYHNWGDLLLMGVKKDAATIRMCNTPRSEALSAWVQGMIEGLIVLSGGDEPMIEETECEARGDEACVFRCRWSWAPGSDRSWR